MGQSPNSLTQTFEDDKAYLLRFRRVLWKSDQWIIDDLLAFAEKHLYEIEYAGHSLPFLMLLFAMVVEEQKKIKKMEQALHDLKEEK